MEDKISELILAFLGLLGYYYTRVFHTEVIALKQKGPSIFVTIPAYVAKPANLETVSEEVTKLAREIEVDLGLKKDTLECSVYKTKVGSCVVKLPKETSTHDEIGQVWEKLIKFVKSVGSALSIPNDVTLFVSYIPAQE
jgi:hypothetical protein